MPGERIDDAELGLLLYHGYGYSRTDVGAVGGWPHHRFVPSARCFYPTELYLWRPESGECSHYDQAHHGLVTLRTGVPFETVSGALRSDLDGAAAVMLLTSHFWKTAFRYRHYAHRLCSQEAGMVAGNLLLVAQSLGLRGHVHYQFLDDSAGRWAMRLAGPATGLRRPSLTGSGASSVPWPPSWHGFRRRPTRPCGSPRTTGSTARWTS